AQILWLVPIQKWLICPISALREKFNPRNINHMAAVRIFARLELNETISFLDGNQLNIVFPHEPMTPFLLMSYLFEADKKF
ncbi:MAG: hypothetical protein P8Z73_08935, partial [Desulfobacteraceae bacterium]